MTKDNPGAGATPAVVPRIQVAYDRLCKLAVAMDEQGWDDWAEDIRSALDGMWTATQATPPTSPPLVSGEQLMGHGGQETLMGGGEQPPSPDGHPTLAEMAQMLRECEWAVGGDDGPETITCPVCLGNKPNHEPRCRLAALLSRLP